MNDGPDTNIDVPTGKQRKVGWQTDVGKVRETDEDFVSVYKIKVVRLVRSIFLL